MFRHQGPARDPRKNELLAGSLALIAGFVNSGGFVMIGSFTSHVTGSVGRLGNDLAIGDHGAAALAALLVVTFWIGAFGASLLIEGSRRGYGLALLAEGALLALFIFIAGLSDSTHPRILDAQAALLCAAMGMQNSMVTRLSGAVVRTTHLTGVVTDLGIEAARWLRWYRRSDGVERPQLAQSKLLGTIAVAFTSGAVLGATLTSRASRWAMIVPAAAVLALAGVALRQSRDPAENPAAP